MNAKSLTVIMGGLLATLFTHGVGLAEGQEDLTIFRAPDPAIIKYDGTYYLFATGRGIRIYTSEDLVHWRPAGRVLDPMPEWSVTDIPGARPGWAPDIYESNGRFFLYYSVSTVGSQRSAIGLAVNSTLDPQSEDYNWEDRGKVLESFPATDDFNAIDPAVFRGQDGNLYMVWGSHWTGIKGAQINPDTGKPYEDDFDMVSLARAPRNAIEAPLVIYREGYYYMFVSHGTTLDGAQSTYRVMVGRSENPLGPYLDFHGRPMMDRTATLVLGGHENWRGPGHNAVLQDSKGDFLVHHAISVDHMEHRRALQIRPMYWSDDGWPMVTEPFTAGLDAYDFQADLSDHDLAGKWHVYFDYEAEAEFDFLQDGRIADSENARWTNPEVNRFSLRLERHEQTGQDDSPQVAEYECVLEPSGRFFVGRNADGGLVRGKKLCLVRKIRGWFQAPGGPPYCDIMRFQWR